MCGTPTMDWPGCGSKKENTKLSLDHLARNASAVLVAYALHSEKPNSQDQSVPEMMD